jgi:hypothetical protein
VEDQEFQAFLDSAVDELERKNHLLRETYGIGSLARWWFDQALQKVQFFDNDDTLAVEAEAIAIGSFAPQSKSWRWAWANDTALPEMRQRSESLRQLAQVTGFTVFSQEHAFEVDNEEMAWEFVALSVRHLGASGGYRIPSSNRALYTYLALMGVRRVAA